VLSLDLVNEMQEFGTILPSFSVTVYVFCKDCSFDGQFFVLFIYSFIHCVVVRTFLMKPFTFK